MPADKSNRTRELGVGALMVVVLFAVTTLHAQSANAPEGSWSGHTNGKARVVVNLTVRSGLCAYSDPYVNLPGNRCSWQPTASNGGILTIFYETYAPTQVFHNKVYLGITWVTRDQILARAGPGDDGAATLNRQ